MAREKLMEKAIEVLSKLPDQKLIEVSDFAEFLVEKVKLAEETQQLIEDSKLEKEPKSMEAQNKSTHQLVRREERLPRIGVFGVGYFKYWPQFEGLLEALLKKQEVLIEKIKRNQVEVVDFGLVDDVQTAYGLVPKLKSANLDLIFCDMLTYATSSTFGVIIKNIDSPIVLVALQPDKAMDYSKASTYMQLYNDDICSLPEFAGVAVRMGKSIPGVIIGTLHDDPESEEAINEYCRIAKVLNGLKTARIGHIGHPIEAMLDICIRMPPCSRRISAFMWCNVKPIKL